MDPDDHVCLCFHVSLRKIANFIVREEPRVPSQISDCLGAGTGCQWCVPFLRKLHALHAEGKPIDLPVSPEEYANRRARYRKTGQRDGAGADEAGADEARADGTGADGAGADEARADGAGADEARADGTGADGAGADGARPSGDESGAG